VDFAMYDNKKQVQNCIDAIQAAISLHRPPTDSFLPRSKKPACKPTWRPLRATSYRTTQPDRPRPSRLPRCLMPSVSCMRIRPTAATSDTIGLCSGVSRNKLTGTKLRLRGRVCSITADGRIAMREMSCWTSPAHTMSARPQRSEG
jgi:hypothetical protein